MSEDDLTGYLVSMPNTPVQIFYNAESPWDAAAKFVKEHTHSEVVGDVLASMCALLVVRYYDGAEVTVISPLWALLGVESG